MPHYSYNSIIITNVIILEFLYTFWLQRRQKYLNDQLGVFLNVKEQKWS